jgi:uncharacterized coiled-coil DUF342 family protein
MKELPPPHAETRPATDPWEKLKLFEGNLQFLDGLGFTARIESRFYLASEVDAARSADQDRIAALQRALDDMMEKAKSYAAKVDARTEEMLSYKKALDEAQQERDSYKREVERWIEREAMCCPEDVGFDEWIKILRNHRDRLKAAMEEALTFHQTTHIHAVIRAVLNREE